MRKLISSLLIAVVATVACGGRSAPTADDRLHVVATTTIIGDVVSASLGDGADVEVMMSGVQDPHSFRASSDQVARLYDADLVVANGLDLEEALVPILEAAAKDGVRVLYLGDYADPLPLSGDGEAADPGAPVDPHFWFDPLRMARAVDHLGDVVAEIAPTRTSEWRQAIGAYRDLLEQVDGEIRRRVADLPEAARILVTNHDSLRYFAKAYGFTIVGTVIPGATTIAEPSASDLAELVTTITDYGVRAIFADTTRPTRLAEIVAAEAGTEVAVVELYTGALGPSGSGADTYLGYLRSDADTIVRALAP